MKLLICTLAVILLITGCQSKNKSLPIEGSWKLLSGTVTENGNTTVTDYTKDKTCIKIINGTHFSFLGHDLNKGKDSASAFFSVGGGSYTLKDSTYTERLEYCNAREWENNDFKFTVTIKNDTLIQSGVEKVEGTNIDRFNVEKYIRIVK